MSGYWVAEWLPQIVILVTSRTVVPVLAASWAMARLWSRRVMAVKRSSGMFGALFMAIRALVLAGLPTTRMRTSDAALSERALPWTVKMAPLASRRSLRSMPFDRGRAPTSRAKFTSPKASLGSSVWTMPSSSGKAQSSSSMATPLRASRAGVMSSRCRMTG